MKQAVFLTLIILVYALKAQGLALYTFETLDQPRFDNRKALFVSLSESYPLSEHPDSQAVPDLKNLEQEDLIYFRLDSKYRKRFLSKTKISETDSVFVYDYSTDALYSLPVKDLNVAASLSPYADCETCDQYDYMIGFEVRKNLLTGIGKDERMRNILAYVGKKNPFARKQMKAIVWEKIDAKDFPLAKSNLKTNAYGGPIINKDRSSAYIYKHDNFLYYLQDFNDVNSKYLHARHLLVIDSKSGNVVIEKIFSEGEGTSLSILNEKNQWTGKLFNDKPPVVFGFEYGSFGCPGFIFLNKAEKDLFTKCDNRH